jgi:hypothetical protein
MLGFQMNLTSSLIVVTGQYSLLPSTSTQQLRARQKADRVQVVASIIVARTRD